MRLVIDLKFSKRWILFSLAALALVGGAGGLWLSTKKPVVATHAAKLSNPIPAGIREQLSYQAIYPSDTTVIDANSIAYAEQQKTLSFNVADSSNTIVFTEQPAPSSLGSGTQIYFQAIGLHPYAQFESTLGPVALAKFYNSGSLNAAGESAVLASHGTLVIAHSNAALGNDDWKNLFNNLKLAK